MRIVYTKPFINSCQYRLTGTNSWEIDFQTVNCDQWSTCKKKLIITLGGFNIVAIGKNVTINGYTIGVNDGYVNGRKEKQHRIDYKSFS